MLQKDPNKRSTLEEIAQDPWVSSNGQEEIDFKIEDSALDDKSGMTNDNVAKSIKFGNMKRLIKKFATHKLLIT